MLVLQIVIRILLDARLRLHLDSALLLSVPTFINCN